MQFFKISKLQHYINKMSEVPFRFRRSNNKRIFLFNQKKILDIQVQCVQNKQSRISMLDKQIKVL